MLTFNGRRDLEWLESTIEVLSMEDECKEML